MTKLAWGNRIDRPSRDRVREIAARHGIDPSWLMACMAFETGETFAPGVRNAASGATGLIQFMPRTAVALGTTTDELAQMTVYEQLGRVEEYFEPYLGRLKTLSDTYMAILWPKAVGQPEDFPLFKRGSKAYEQNAGLDTDGDGVVTKAEATAKVAAKLERGWKIAADDDAPVEDRSTIYNPEQEAPMAPIVPILLSTLASAVPDIAKIFAGSNPSEVAKRNTALVEKVAEVVVAGANAANLGEAVQKASESPQIAAQVAQAIRQDSTLSLMLVEAGGGGIGAARAFAVATQGNAGMVSVLRVVTFWVLGFLTFANVAGFALAGFLLYLDKGDWQQIVSALIQADIAAAFAAIGFWLGSSIAKGGTPTVAVRE